MRSCSPPPMAVGTVGTGSGQLGPDGVSEGGGWVVVGVGVGGVHSAMPWMVIPKLRVPVCSVKRRVNSVPAFKKY